MGTEENNTQPCFVVPSRDLDVCVCVFVFVCRRIFLPTIVVGRTIFFAPYLQF